MWNVQKLIENQMKNSKIVKNCEIFMWQENSRIIIRIIIQEISEITQ